MGDIFPETTDDAQQIESQAIKISNEHSFFRYVGTRKIEDLIGVTARNGMSYHLISGGGISAFAYLMWIWNQQVVDELICSTWKMSIADCYEFQRAVKIGRIKKLSIYVGSLFKYSYPSQYALAGDVCRSTGGRICMFNNHSKVMAGHGKKFSFAIEGSANVMANPRTEQTSITISKKLATFYLDFYKQVKTRDKSQINI